MKKLVFILLSIVIMSCEKEQILEDSNISNLEIYPNPSTGFFTVNFVLQEQDYLQTVDINIINKFGTILATEELVIPLSLPIVNPTWDCINGDCIDPGTGNGQYALLSACQIACGVTPTWDCINGDCIDPGTGQGSYASLSSCQSACVNTTIIVGGPYYHFIFNLENTPKGIYFVEIVTKDGFLRKELILLN